MRTGADTGTGEVELSGIGLGVVDQLAHGLGRDAGVHDHQVDRHQQRRDADEILRIVGQRLDQMRIEDLRPRGREQQRVAVRSGLGDAVGSDDRPGAGLVLDDHRLLQPLAQAIADETRHDVGPAARRKRHDDANDPRRIGLRPHVGGKQDGRCAGGQQGTPV